MLILSPIYSKSELPKIAAIQVKYKKYFHSVWHQVTILNCTDPKSVLDQMRKEITALKYVKFEMRDVFYLYSYDTSEYKWTVETNQ